MALLLEERDASAPGAPDPLALRQHLLAHLLALLFGRARRRPLDPCALIGRPLDLRSLD